MKPGTPKLFISHQFTEQPAIRAIIAPYVPMWNGFERVMWPGERDIVPFRGLPIEQAAVLVDQLPLRHQGIEPRSTSSKARKMPTGFTPVAWSLPVTSVARLVGKV